MSDSNPPKGKTKGLICGVIAGSVSAFLLFFALAHANSVLILLSYLSAVPLFMAGLGAGILSGFAAAFVGAAGLFALAPTSYAVFYLIADAVPALLLIMLSMRQRRDADGKVEWAAEGNTLAALAVYPCFIFLGVFLVTADHPGGLLDLTVTALESMTGQVTDMLTQNGQQVTPEVTVKIHEYMQLFARMMPAIAMCTWLLVTIIAMVVAQGVLRQQNWSLRPAFSLVKLHVPNWVIFAAAVTGIAAVYAPAPYDYLGLNLALVLGVPFFLTGLAVVHAWAATTRAPNTILILFYIVISVIVHFALLIALLGAVDQWADFRKRLAAKNSTKPLN